MNLYNNIFEVSAKVKFLRTSSYVFQELLCIMIQGIAHFFTGNKRAVFETLLY